MERTNSPHYSGCTALPKFLHKCEDYNLPSSRVSHKWGKAGARMIRRGILYLLNRFITILHNIAAR